MSAAERTLRELVSTGRGGTTWLAEIVTSLLNRVLVRALPPRDQEQDLTMAHDLGVTCYTTDPRPDLPEAARRDPS